MDPASQLAYYRQQLALLLRVKNPGPDVAVRLFFWACACLHKHYAFPIPALTSAALRSHASRHSDSTSVRLLRCSKKTLNHRKSQVVAVDIAE